MSDHGLLTITGGKWTSYRKMAEDTIDKAIHLGMLESRKCVTRSFRIHGWREHPNLHDHCYVYGSDEEAIELLEAQNPDLQARLSDKYDYRISEVVWAVRNEMARTVEDVLARRVRLLFLDAKEAIAVAPTVAGILAHELNKDEAWKDEQIKAFNQVAAKYVIDIPRETKP